MQKIKILIIILFLFVGFAFNGELYMLYLDNFQESYYQSTFCISSPENDADNKQMIQDFVNAGENNNVDFYMIDWQLESVYKTNIIIYGTTNAIETLKEDGINEGDNDSLFFGSSKVEYKLFKNLNDISICKHLYYIGAAEDKERMDAFKAELVDQYGGGFPKMLGSDRETYLNLAAVWGTLFFLFLMITLYGVVYQKKERMVRIVLGENIKTLFLKNLLIETLLYALLFFSISGVLLGFSNTHFKFTFVIILFLIFLATNALINAMILRINFKKDLSTANNGKTFLRINYVLKFLSTTLVVAILASNYIIIKNAYNLYEQREFFNEHDKYSYIRLDYKDFNIDEDNYISINQNLFEEFQDDALMYIDLTDNFDATYPVLLINRGAMKEVLTENPILYNELNGLKEEKIYMLLPGNVPVDSEEAYYAREIVNTFFYNSVHESAEEIVYEGNSSMVGIHKNESYRMTLYKNPILIYNNTTFKKKPSFEGYDMYYTNDTMYNISNKDYQTFIEEHNLTDQITVKSNVLEVYEHEWGMVSRNMRLILLLSAFLIMLEMSLIVFIIRMNYQFNSLELALQKIHGYSLAKRNNKIVIITIVSSVIGIVAALLLSAVLDMQGGYPLIIIGFALMALEEIYILHRAKKMEKKEIASILKGESI